MTVLTSKPGEYVTLKANAALTALYAGFVSDWLYVGDKDAVKFAFTVTGGDETSIEMLVDTGPVTLANDGQYVDPATAYEEDVVGPVASGVSPVTPHELQFVAAARSGKPYSEGFTWRNEAQVHAVRVRAKLTGGVTAPQVEMRAVARGRKL